MKMTLKIIATLLATSTLVACGGSGSSAVTPSPQPQPQPQPQPEPDPITFSDIGGIASNLENKYEEVPFSDESMIPLSGTADYAGAFDFDFNGTYEDGKDKMRGLGELNFDFNSGTPLSGRVTDLVLEDGTEIAGQVQIANGEVDRQSGAFANQSYSETVEANLAAVLTLGDGEVTTLTGELGGDFRGRNREGLVGVMSGTLTEGDDSTQWSGEFYTEK